MAVPAAAARHPDGAAGRPRPARVVRARPGGGLRGLARRRARRPLRDGRRRAPHRLRDAAGERQPRRRALGAAHRRVGRRPARRGPPARRADRAPLDERGPRRRPPRRRSRAARPRLARTSTWPSTASAAAPAARPCSRSTASRRARRRTRSRCACMAHGRSVGEDRCMSKEPLVGREDELRAIGSLLAAAGDRGGALVVRGEPGIGKSTLLAGRPPRGRASAACGCWRQPACSPRATCRSPACTSSCDRCSGTSRRSPPPSRRRCWPRSGWAPRPRPTGS